MPLRRRTGGWRELLPGKDLTAWQAPTGDWATAAEVAQDAKDTARLAWKPGVGPVVNGPRGSTVNLVSKQQFSDIEAHVEFLIPAKSNSGVYFMGRYEIQVYDSYGVKKDKYPGIECGGIYPRWIGREIEGHSPRVNAALPPGQWQTFDVTFRAPRFDAAGKKVSNARFVKVVHNGKVIHENIPVTGSTRGALYEDEKPTGPLMLQGDHGPVAYRSVRIRPLPPEKKAKPAPRPATAQEESIQGLYEGATVSGDTRTPCEARVVAAGRDTYKLFLRPCQASEKGPKVDLDGKGEEKGARFAGKSGEEAWALFCDGVTLEGTGGAQAKLSLKRVVRPSPTLGTSPPDGAIVLLDGKSFTEMTVSRRRDGTAPEWKQVEDGGVEIPRGGMRTKRPFDGSFKLHVEFRVPLQPEARGQGRGNSGVYLPCGQEIQVLDSFGMTTYKGGGCGGLYSYKDPDAFDRFSLASLPPLQWQTYDIEYRVQHQDGKPTGNPRVTVLHNGIKIHDNVKLGHKARAGNLFFQDHGNPVAYRNIWLLPLKD
ncbi:MAG: DUF1080 domain-containing protein [Gemmataceae bacterium]